MVEIIGVRFRPVGKIYYFDPDGMNIEKGTNVIVETARGIEYGEVVIANREVDDDKITSPLKKKKPDMRKKKGTAIDVIFIKAF